MRDHIHRFVESHARPVEVAFLAARQSQGAVSDLLDELAKFQNTDGGFGHGLEPDLRTPDSSALSTSVAFQYLSAIGPSVRQSSVVHNGLRYLLESFVEDEGRWQPIAASTPDHPSAPWWDYERSLLWTDWGNPSAELLGHLMRFSDTEEHADMLAALTEQAVDRLNDIDESEFHELLCFQRLFQAADEPTKARFWPRLSSLIVAAVEHDPGKWSGYGATPLTFVDSPASPFISLFEQSAIDADLQRLLDTLVANNHWEPDWSWGEDHLDAWTLARTEWIGVLTVRNLLTLESFKTI